LLNVLIHSRSVCLWQQLFDRFHNQSIDNQWKKMSGKKGKSKGASADGDSGEASGGSSKGGTSVKVNKY